VGARRWSWSVAVATVVAAASVAGCGADPDLPHPGLAQGAIDRCDWPMWGHGPDRTFSYPCRTDLSPSTAGDLERRWFFNAADVVTATPAVVDDTVYVGDWSGRFYALRREDGRPRWTYDTEAHENVYSGQIVSSAAVADVGGERTVFFGGGKTLYALRADDGRLLWRHELNPGGPTTDPTEIETSPVVVDGTVIIGWDVHNSDAGEPAGVLALDAATGRVRWTFLTEPRGDATGCGDVWASPSVDVARGLVFAATGNCPRSPDGWGRHTEALFALDLRSGRPRWSYQPHQPNNDDFDFAGAPNLFVDRDGRALVGLGNKDAAYYAVDRATGEAVWQRRVAEPGITRPGSNFSTGGFIGPTAFADGIVVGGTAVGGDPYLHAIDASTGAVRWQQPEAAATYAAAVEANGVVIIGGTDFTLRALDLRSGRVLWRREMTGVVAGGAVVVGNDVIAVAGIREPGITERSRTSGVTLFSLDAGRAIPTSTASTESTTTAPTTRPADAPEQACVGAPCPFPFDLVEPPAGLQPTATLEVSLDPWQVRFRAEGLGKPEAWLRPGSQAAKDGADAFALFISERDDNPQGGLLCELDDDLSCTSDLVPRAGATYTRITLLAVRSGTGLPSVTEGIDRLVATRAFDEPVQP
jgi:outer membrane protein assembly factor BamB